MTAYRPDETSIPSSWDYDGDLTCDVYDEDDDNDGALDENDSDDKNPNVSFCSAPKRWHECDTAM